MKQLSQIEAIDVDRIHEEYGAGPDKYDIQVRTMVEEKEADLRRKREWEAVAIATATGVVLMTALVTFAVTDPALDKPIPKEYLTP